MNSEAKGQCRFGWSKMSTSAPSHIFDHLRAVRRLQGRTTDYGTARQTDPSKIRLTAESSPPQLEQKSLSARVPIGRPGPLSLLPANAARIIVFQNQNS